MQYTCPVCQQKSKCLDDEWPDTCDNCGYDWNVEEDAEEEKEDAEG